MDHFVQREAGRGVVAQADLGEGITNESDVDPVCLAGTSGRKIVGSKHGNGCASFAHLLEVLDGDLLAS